MRVNTQLLTLLLGQLVAGVSAVSPSSAFPASQFDLPNAFPGSDFVPDPFDVDAIRNVLAHYPLAIDGKNFAALDLVFAPNASANYSEPLGVLTPLANIETGLQNSLAAVTTQHSFGTQVIDVLSPDSAISVTYYTATHFGKGAYAGQIVTAYGQYQDIWARQRDQKWRICQRELVFMGPFIGNLSIFL